MDKFFDRLGDLTAIAQDMADEMARSRPAETLQLSVDYRAGAAELGRALPAFACKLSVSASARSSKHEVRCAYPRSIFGPRRKCV